MKAYKDMSRDELLTLKTGLEAEFKKAKEMNLSLNMARGKPGASQLALSMPMLDVINSQADMNTLLGNDTRNYGDWDGIGECRRLLADMIGVKKDNVIVCGNSSLNIMYDTVVRSMVKGVNGSTPWCKLDKVKFLCPVPGYDRHFAITQYFGIEMINVPMTKTGPDMDLVEKLVQEDASVKGIWCVPKYSNPQGITYADETVRRFAALKPAAPDFRIYWDNAYAVHDLYEDDKDELLPIMRECEKAGSQDMVYEFCSTSKVTFSGAGISAMGMSEANRNDMLKQMSVQTIGHDKIKQWTHTRYLKNMDGVRAHMAKHAAIIRPKFEAVDQILSREIAPRGIGTWVKPKGGYFICFEALEGCARAIVKKAKEAGIELTAAGAPFPYRIDPRDATIRIAPTFPELEEMKQAADVFACCVRLVSVEKLLAECKQ